MHPKGDPYSLARAFEGRTFGGYRIARAIATGGMATVFLARRTGPGRFAQNAALKVIHPHLAQEREFVEMFLEEARIASSINHPNVCRVLDFGQAEGTYYLAMEYIRGETWATALERLTAQRESRVRLQALSSYVIAQACEGLHAVHEAVDPNGLPLQIVHRDISPQNLFIAYDGSVRVLDFGIASAAAPPGGQTSTTQVIKGRYAYMAPEQARGEQVDRRADIWSLGVCLREALSGERLFERDTQVATIMAVTKDDLPQWPKHVPLLLREICDKALERDLEQRYQTARELGSALARVAASEAEPAGGAEVGRWMRLLFPEQIAQKRAELKELAGGEDTNTGTFTSIVPRALTGAHAAAEAQPTPARGNPRLRKLGRRASTWLTASGLAVGAAYLAFWLTPQTLPEQAATSATAAASAKATPKSAEPQPAAEAPLAAAPVEPASVAATAVEPAAPAEAPAAPPKADEPAKIAEKATTGGDESKPATAEEERRKRRRAREESAAAEAAEKPSKSSDDKVEKKASAKAPEAEAAKPKPAETAAAPNNAPGTLLVAAASGWAEVSLDGKALGTTPFKVSIPAGSHRLDVRFFGTGSPQPMNVVVQPGAVTKLRLSQ